MSEIDPIDGVIAILDRGQKTGTNKLGLLLALIELAPTAADGRIETAAIAEQLLEIHWDHATPVPLPHIGPVVLRQVTSSNRESTVVSQAARLRGLLPPQLRAWPYPRVRTRLRSLPEWDDALARIEHDTVRNPVARLQTIDGVGREFLYRVDRGAVVLTPAAQEALIRFGPVLRPLIESQFVALVLRANRASRLSPIEEQVHRHLFGPDREMPAPSVRHELLALQGGRCVYTGERLGRDTACDHVMPWSRTRFTALGNFLITSPRTNSAKRDFLLGLPMAQRWAEHLRERGGELERLAADSSWFAGTREVLELAQSLYRHAAAGTVLWDPSGIRPATTDELDRIAAELAA